MERERTFAVDLAKQAGAIIRQNFSLGMKKQWKDDQSPLTVTDTKINDLVVSAVKEQFPDHGILTEEAKEILGAGEYIWVCDPVDGTMPFSHGIPTCGFSLALVHNGLPVLGVFMDPFLDRLIVGEHKAGATMNGSPLRVSSATTLERAYMGAEGWKSWRKGQQIDPALLWEAFSTNGGQVFRLGSFVYQAMLVAAGELVGAMFPLYSPWDAAAVKVIVEEAGGRVTDMNGQNQRYDRPINGLIASNGLLHDALLRIVAESRKK